MVALYDFSGQTREDLSFKQGDRILVTKHLDVEWWTGRLNGREGIFPRAFVKGSQGTMGLRAWSYLPVVCLAALLSRVSVEASLALR